MIYYRLYKLENKSEKKFWQRKDVVEDKVLLLILL